MTITYQLQDAIRASGLSLNQIAKAVGIAHPMLSHFLSDKPGQQRDIRLRTADKLAEFFGLELVATSARSPAGQKVVAAKPAVGKPAATKTAVAKSVAAAATSPPPAKPRLRKKRNTRR